MGLTLIFFKARTIQGPEMPEVLLVLGEGFAVGPFFVTFGLLVMFALYFVVAWVLRNTAWGKHVYAVGDDPVAAQLSGINANRVLFSVYLVAGLIMGIAAYITIGRVGSASPNVDPMLNLQSITAVVIGGISLFGGSWSSGGSPYWGNDRCCRRNGIVPCWCRPGVPDRSNWNFGHRRRWC